MNRSIPPDHLLHINQICDEFEDQILAGKSPEIETTLAKIDEAIRSQTLTELLRLELHYRTRNGPVPEIDSYYLRFPNSREIVLTAFDATAEEKFDETWNQEPLATAPIEIVRDNGDLIGRFTIEKKLGTGAFAEVYLAYDLENSRPVAVKVMKPTKIGIEPNSWNPRVVQSFVEEAETLSGMAHPAIAQIYDIGEDENGLPFVAMEYVKGDTLQFLLRENLISTEAAVKLIASIADSLAYVHQQDVFHRDLKPANIVVGLDEQPRIVDFGLAVQESVQHRREGEVAGSVTYMSPEQIRGQSHRLDGRSDIWALGVMLYEVLTSRLPFKGESLRQLVDDIRHRAPRPLRQINQSVTPGLESVCLKSLAKDSCDRYLTAQDFAAELREELKQFSESTSAVTSHHAATRAGRAELRLAAQARIWNEKPEKRRLPTLLQYLQILTLTKSKIWTENESRMMNATSAHHIKRIIGISAVLAVTAAAGILLSNYLTNDYVVENVASMSSANRDDFAEFSANLEPYILSAIPKAISGLGVALEERDELRTRNGLLWLLANQQTFSSLTREQKLEVRNLLTPVFQENVPFVDGMQYCLPAVDAGLQQKILDAHGVIKERFVCCSTLPSDDWQLVSERLDNYGFRPSYRQSYSFNGSELLAATWIRSLNLPSIFQRKEVDSANIDVEFDIDNESNPDYFEDFPGIKFFRLNVVDQIVSNESRFSQQLRFGNEWLRRDEKSTNAKFLIARALFQLGDAKESLRLLLELSTVPGWTEKAPYFQLLALVHAKNGDRESALASLEKLARVLRAGPYTPVHRERIAAMTKAKTLCFCGDPNASETILEAWLMKNREEHDLFSTASVYSAASRHIEHDKIQSKKFLDRAVELIREVFEQDDDYRSSFVKEEGLEAVRNVISLQDLTGSSSYITYSAKWDPAGGSSIFVKGQFPEKHTVKVRSKVTLHRPDVVAAVHLPGDVMPTVASIWRSDNSETASHCRQRTRIALAATALARLAEDHSQVPFNLLRSADDPGLRTELIQTFRKLKVDPVTKLLPRISAHEDQPDIQQAVIEAIGLYDKHELERNRTSILKTLNSVENEDLGVLAAINWLKNKLGSGNALDETGESDSSIAIDGKSFFVNDLGQRMVAIAESRDQAPLIWMADTELTNNKLVKLAGKLGLNSTRDNDVPAVRFSFYQIAEICNAMSELAGIPKDQWCFLPNDAGDYAAGMKIKADFTNLAGYRLATPTDWEFACRAGAKTKWFHGNDPKFLEDYAWHNPTTELKSVAQLMPNRFGLFDMSGNALEWSMPISSGTIDDQTMIELVGGSSWLGPKESQASRRLPSQANPTNHRGSIGFRFVVSKQAARNR